ncbi:MAG: nucleoside hydrolase [Verrucomicrobia bacterium]|nr:nucleoside hydrolase [Verrucomicrobiota bacterium]MCF7708846.1 nucleoside hydrolase [Verrucomicrobiota bacterium]
MEDKNLSKPITCCLCATIALILATVGPSLIEVSATGAEENAGKKIPVILDTDIGDDIDDTWALGFLLSCPEYDVKLVIGDNGKPLYRARLIAKFLEKTGCTDIPVGMGVSTGQEDNGAQSAWVEDYNLNDYPGKVYPDGVRALVDTIMESDGKMRVICVGPVQNIRHALEMEPKIAERAEFIGMHGSVRRGYGGSSEPDAEYNVRVDPAACRAAFNAPWDVTITPLDTCGIVTLDGDRYQTVFKSDSKVAKAIVENYRIWSGNGRNIDYKSRSSVLYDTVAVYLGLTRERLKIERLGIKVDDEGRTLIDEGAKPIDVATEWKDLDGFKDFLVGRLEKGVR